MLNTNSRQQPYVYGSLGGAAYCLSGDCSSGADGSEEQRFWQAMQACGRH
jgi:hypothetical protein